MKKVNYGISVDIKRKACEKVRDLISYGKEAKLSVKEVAFEFNVSTSTIYQWNRNFGKIFEKNVYLPLDEKIKILNEVLQIHLSTGHSIFSVVKHVAKDKNIKDLGQIYDWNNEFNVFPTIEKEKVFSEDEKIKICKDVLNTFLFENTDNNKSIKMSVFVAKTAEKFGVDKSSIYEWNKIYKIFQTQKSYTQDEKIKILNDILNYSLEAKIELVDAIKLFAKNKNLNHHTIYVWNRTYNILPVKENTRNPLFSEEKKRNILNEVKEKLEKFSLEDDFSKYKERNLTFVVKEVAKNYSLSYFTLYKWNKEFSCEYWIPKSYTQSYGVEALYADKAVYSK